jgi:hypothetical protein
MSLGVDGQPLRPAHQLGHLHHLPRLRDERVLGHRFGRILSRYSLPIFAAPPESSCRLYFVLRLPTPCLKPLQLLGMSSRGLRGLHRSI